jgi:hypothetical protein
VIGLSSTFGKGSPIGQAPLASVVSAFISKHPIICDRCSYPVEVSRAQRTFDTEDYALSFRCPRHGVDSVTLDGSLIRVHGFAVLASMLPARVFLRNWAKYSLEKPARAGKRW